MEVDGGGLLMGAAYQHHPNLQLAEATYDSGTRFLADRGTNGMGRPARLRVVSPTGSTWFDTGVYQYDPAGHIWAIGADRYTYDPAGRLKTATVAQAGSGRSEAYTYDPFGNLLSVAQDSHPINLYQVDAPSNRLRGVAGQSPDIFYDLAGNMTAVGFTLAGTPVFEQGYDALNMAESFLYRNDISGAVTSHYLYLYGPGNRRLMTFDAQTTERVVTLRDLDGQPLRELSVTDWGENAHWQHTHDYLSGAEGLFGRRAAGGIRRYLHRDHLGSLRLLSSGSPFHPVATGEHHYYPFGTSALSWGNDATKAKYTGHERDPHGFADYMMGRTCVFPYQRFMSVDPGRDGWNLYAYVGNDPVRYSDPTGKITKDQAREGLSVGLGFVPGVGDVKDAQEAILGVDLVTGEKLGGWDRAFAGVAVFVPVVSGKAIREGAGWAVRKAGDLRKPRNRPPDLSPEGANRRGAFREAKRQNGVPVSQQPDSVPPT